METCRKRLKALKHGTAIYLVDSIVGFVLLFWAPVGSGTPFRCIVMGLREQQFDRPVNHANTGIPVAEKSVA